MTGIDNLAMDDGSLRAAPAGRNELHGHPGAGSVNASMSELVRLLGARKALQSNDRSERSATLPAVSDEQRRQMWHNVKGFFDTLAEWAKRESDANETVTAQSDADGA